MERILAVILNNFAVKLVSVAIAIVLWTVVLQSRTVEATKEVPLELITPADLVPSNDVPDRVAFRLSGPKAFLRTVMDRREEPIRINLVGAKAGLVTYRLFSDSIRVPIGVKVLSINPTAVLIKLEPLKRKEVPLKLELRGMPPEGYRIVRAEVRPSSVRIKGPESRVDAVTELSTTAVDLSEAYKSVEQDVSIETSRAQVQLDSPAPRVFIEIEPSSANFRIKNVDIQVLSSYKPVLKEKTVTVLVRAAPKDLKALDRRKVYAVVDLRGRPKGDYHEPVQVTLPEQVGLVKVVPDRVKVTLQ